MPLPENFLPRRLSRDSFSQFILAKRKDYPVTHTVKYRSPSDWDPQLLQPLLAVDYIRIPKPHDDISLWMFRTDDDKQKYLDLVAGRPMKWRPLR